MNLFGLIDITEMLIDKINKGGHIINISSGLSVITEGQGAYAPAYRISKSGLNIYTIALANILKRKAKDITVSSVDPGWVKTDMGGPHAMRQAYEPAEEIYQLANSKVESGKFWSHGKIRSW